MEMQPCRTVGPNYPRVAGQLQCRAQDSPSRKGLERQSFWSWASELDMGRERFLAGPFSLFASSALKPEAGPTCSGGFIIPSFCYSVLNIV